MSYDVDIAQRLIGATGISIPVGYDNYPRWLIIANNNIAGNATGPTIQVSPTPADGPTREIVYGEVRHYHLAMGLRWLSIQGNGANVSVVVAYEDVPMSVSTVQITASSGTSNVNITNAAVPVSGTVGVSANGIIYTGGASAGANGVWRFTASVTTAGTPLKVNETAVLPVGFSGTVASTTLTVTPMVYEVQVTSGTTYTITLGTVDFGIIVVS